MKKNLILSDLKFEYSKINNFYLKLFNISQNEKRTLQYHWSNKKKLYEDLKYLKNFYNRAISLLAHELNKKHKIRYKKIKWEIILGPWLWRFLAVYYDRYKILSKINQKVTVKIANFENFKPAPQNFQDFINLFLSKEWNYYICVEIINELKNKNFGKVYLNQKLVKQKKVEEIKNFKFFNQIKSKKLFIQAIGLDKINLLKLFLYFKIFPYKNYIFEKNFTTNKFNKGSREFNINKFKFQNEFEKIFIKNVSKHLPINFLEGFNSNIEFVKKINHYPKNILTSQLHLNSDLFKLWITLPKMKGANLYILRHGGVDLVQANFETLHEIKISKKFFGKFSKNHSKIINSPRPFLINTSKYFKSTGNKILIVDLERGPFNDLRFGPTSNLMKNFFYKTLSLSKKIIANNEIKKHFKIIPYNNEGFNSYLWYKQKIGSKFLAKPKSLENYLGNAKLIICRYPLTAYLRCFYSAPTILYITEDWSFNNQFKKILPTLKKNKLVFFNETSLFNHIISIQEDPYKWWNNKNVIKAKNLFKNQVYKNNTIEDLFNTLKKQIKI